MSDTKDLKKTIARITDTFLGIEDHGIFTCSVQLDYGGSVQGAGQYDLRGSNCAQFLQGILSACGVDSWEKLKGRTVFALSDGGWNSTVCGLAPLPTELGKPIIFAEMFEETP